MSGSRVALFLPSLRGGGAERVMTNLANGMAARGLAVDMVLGKAEGTYLDALAHGIRVVDLGAPRIRGSLRGLVGYLKGARPAGLLSALDHANVVAVVARRLARVETRVVVSLHNTPSEKFRNRGALERARFSTFLRCAYPFADAIVAVSQGVAADYAGAAGLRRQRIEVVYNPVITPALLELARQELHHPWFVPGAPPVIVTVGRLTWQKNHDLLLRAFARLRERLPARLLILGEGELRPQLEAQVAELGLGAEVALPGFVGNPMQYLARADVFALSSRCEGLPTVLIEALAVGTPVVSTDCKSGPAEILKGGALGRLVPVDDAGALAAALEESLRGGRRAGPDLDLERFGLTRAVDSYLRLLGVAP